MSPLIEAYDTIIAQSLRVHELRRGAVIVFRDGHNLIVHRIIRKKAKDGHGLFCQMGDNSSAYSWVGEKDVLGEVLSIVKRRTVIPLEGPVALSVGLGIRLIGLAFIGSDTFLNCVQNNLYNERPGLVLQDIRKLTAAAHHMACRSLSKIFLWTRRKSDHP
jgi:hypothetical protein